MLVRIVGAIAFVAAAVAVPIATAGGEATEPRALRADVDTKLTIIASRTNPDAESPAQFDMNGKITTSPKSDAAKKCKRRRKVTVYYRAPGGNLDKGTTKTNRRGKWYLASSQQASVANGTYFARTPKATRAGQKCSGDKSPDHVIDYDTLP